MVELVDSADGHILNGRKLVCVHHIIVTATASATAVITTTIIMTATAVALVRSWTGSNSCFVE